MQLNPIIAKELRVLLRSRRGFGLQLAYVGLLCLIVVVVWPRGGVYSLGSLASRDLFTILSLGQLILIALFSPAFTSTSITVEKERGTFDLLYGSLLKPRSIIIGKLVSSVAILLMLILSSLPVMSVSFILGGVALTELGQAVLVLVVATTLFGLIGLCLSAVSARSYTSTFITYLLILLLGAGVWIPSFVLASWLEALPVFHTIRSCSPFTAMLSISQPDLLRSYGRQVYSAAEPLGVFLRFSAISIPALIIFFAVVMRKGSSARLRQRERLIRDRKLLSRRKRHFPYYLLDPLKQKSMIRRLDNPVSVKELRNSSMGKARLMIRGMYVCFIFSMVLMGLASGAVGVWDPDAIKIVAVCFQVGLIVLIAPSLTAGAITSEKEHDNFDLLRMTLLRSHTVIIGKMVVPLRHMLLLILSTFPMFGMLWYLDYYSVTRVALCAGVMMITLLFALVSGIFASSLCRATSSATAWAYGIVSCLSVATFLALFVRDRLSPELFQWIMVWNPFMAAITAVTDQAFTEISIWPQTAVCLVMLSVIMLILTILRFASFESQES